MVPMPGVWRKGIHNIRINRLTMKVDSPIDQPVCTASPCASTVHGLTPSPAAMISASPKPKSASPIHSITTDSTGGRKLNGCGALQNKAGTCRTLKNLPIADIRFSAGILQLSRRYFQQCSDIQPSPVKGKFSASATPPIEAKS